MTHYKYLDHKRKKIQTIYLYKKQNEGNVPKKQNEYGDYKGDYNPSKRNYVTNYSKPPASNSSDRWTKAFGNS